ncbi:hypothetical protein GCM10010300_77310 [Streptomyces olivaceoviridis]|uniref:DUF2637 domain-containing protein n=1 Tax=Streptomyces olivaceoviridis TaxID=1921 RepID=UPI001674BEA0|nr:DUF2637 domain-containing protein [Streptomyces olivaceoviridis]GGZ22112.1 hypothetical protein GCM10010300_77310 [Streptomyces olivaceoviridis]
MADRPKAPPPFTKAQKWVIAIAGVFFAGLAGLGGYGSFAAVEDVARARGFGGHSWIVPIGVDLGILALLTVDLVLEQLDMPLPPLRWLAWAFTSATIWFNMAAVDPDLPWPDRITGQGMHAAMPLLFIAFMEGVRHAIRRRTGLTSQRRMDGIRLSRWFLDPPGTFGIWRRMVLWEVRSYRTGLILEKHRRQKIGDLKAEYGRGWRRKAPAEKLWPLRGGMLDLALELTGTTEGTIPAPGGDHPALPTSLAAPMAPELAPAPGAMAPALAPAVQHPVPAPAGTTTPITPATSEETGPRPAGTAAARTHTPGTITVKVPTDATTDGDHTTSQGTTGEDHEPRTGTTSTPAASAHGPGPQRPLFYGPLAEGRHPEAGLAQGTNPRAREHQAPPARPDIDDAKLAEARELARGIIRAGSGKVSRRSLKAAGLTGKTETLQEIADLLNEEIANGDLVLDETA